MSDTVTCPRCHQEVDSPPELAGKTISCPHCSHELMLPVNVLPTVRTERTTTRSRKRVFEDNSVIVFWSLTTFAPGVLILFSVIGTIWYSLAGGPLDGVENGDPVTFYSEDLLPILCAAGIEDFRKAERLARARDAEGLMKMWSDGKVFFAEHEDRARLVDKGQDFSKVEIESGGEAGNVVYVANLFLREVDE